MEKDDLTENDIFLLVQGKINNPDMTLTDLYRQIDEIHPSESNQYYVGVVFIWLVLIGCLFCMLFLSEYDKIVRTSYIVYILIGSLYIYIRNKHHLNNYLVGLLLALLIYIAATTDLTVNQIADYVKSLFV